MLPQLLFVLNLLATWYMVGLIWMVQIVHYAMFDRVGEEAFQRYAVDHARLITPIVMIPMLIEIVSAAGLIAVSPASVPRLWMVIGFALVVVIWASTVFLQVPCHSRFAEGFDMQVYRRLVATNWIRTVAWSVRGGLMAFWLWRMLQTR
ncbi:hypothetical protein [Aporhodopirellula aestuarii]|uniref:DUF1772 domain-containing protein n=1 Tax=Aporhodopirellula aestuarii TaxID=2950107 RepID=A0ABT0U6U3_9BACT|nr:hypothetical protein [Aporhodopirellula aestuarii]MCM2372618.1 hypothetical protein [Aporhodopirellula aestuarii]